MSPVALEQERNGEQEEHNSSATDSKLKGKRQGYWEVDLISFCIKGELWRHRWTHNKFVDGTQLARCP